MTNAISFSTAAFVQLRSIRRIYGAEGGQLYNAIIACLNGELDCPMRKVRGGKTRIMIGDYRAIVRETADGIEVLRVYRVAAR